MGPVPHIGTFYAPKLENCGKLTVCKNSVVQQGVTRHAAQTVCQTQAPGAAVKVS